MRLLQGVRVLEVGGFITGPLAAMILGEYGADVIKIERPDGGDPFRSHGTGGFSPAFQAHNRNKRSIAVDYAKQEGLAVLHALVKTADVFINNNRPGVADRMGFSPMQLRQLNPRLIYCAITGFGADGPYAQRPAFDNVGQALSGWMSRHRRDDDPRVVGPAISDPATSYYAASAVLAALFERERSGKGRLVEVNMLEATIALNLEPLDLLLHRGRARAAVPARRRLAGLQPRVQGRQAPRPAHVVTGQVLAGTLPRHRAAGLDDRNTPRAPTV